MQIYYRRHILHFSSQPSQERLSAMDGLLDVRSQIYKWFHGSSAGPDFFFLAEHADEYAAYYTSMFLVQDTAEAVLTHMNHGFSQNSYQAYIEVWGVLQAILIQQDAICELHRAITGKQVDVSDLCSWRQLRDTRNLCAGHPANRTHGVPAPQRTFMGRKFGNYDCLIYDCLIYELWDAHTAKTSHPRINLRQMILGYASEGCEVLRSTLNCMKTRWPSRV